MARALLYIYVLLTFWCDGLPDVFLTECLPYFHHYTGSMARPVINLCTQFLHFAPDGSSDCLTKLEIKYGTGSRLYSMRFLV